ncbi:hypothetical protein HMPREF2976_11445 [Corynebacterium sp. HMSC077D10]|uniref:hypothetical protein n=1 Tax=Corynebacterium sp. HMSC077D10 TaxID=1739480 RepID=UPI0008A4A62E|nr:hypothetical protein [Corynebacterium sp. HMSC077D10]OFP66436.1 hypothetical protein HMPREF2976_11445 [Corynebacterium sp. HMSC077D10]
MKNFRVYTPEKYSTPDYIKVEENIYQQAPDREYVTSLSFEQEPELSEGDSPQDISQYPLENILEEFAVQIEDFYEDLNDASESTCFLEFGGGDVERIREVLGLVGKRAYNKTDEDGGEVLVIE